MNCGIGCVNFANEKAKPTGKPSTPLTPMTPKKESEATLLQEEDTPERVELKAFFAKYPNRTKEIFKGASEGLNPKQIEACWRMEAAAKFLRNKK